MRVYSYVVCNVHATHIGSFWVTLYQGYYEYEYITRIIMGMYSYMYSVSHSHRTAPHRSVECTSMLCICVHVLSTCIRCELVFTRDTPREMRDTSESQTE